MTAPHNHDKPAGLRKFFAEEIRAWHGHAPLASVFWLRGVLGSSVLILLYATTVYLEQAFAEQALLVIFGGYTIWILVAIWRCSQADDTFWSFMARLLTVAWAGNAAMILLFRQLDLLSGYF